jgi:hypothetical protein
VCCLWNDAHPTAAETPCFGCGYAALWADDGTLTNQGDPNSPYVGSERLRAFWQNSGSFKNRRLSLVPSFKTQIDVRSDDEA